ncbi:wax ester/triacylglycerol synthase family O-acyltransferase [uncultured Jatrophihabitans sp.]|uniref:WS/DGAT/MGAT family O-acyltransferase n=1 Tax=uncultured Jatrophihabitans sp. TaxID=1610747 RepID=UPI0035CA0863
MLLPMSPTSSMFLLAETRDNPMHVASLQLYLPPKGATALDIRALFEEAIEDGEVAPLFLKRPKRSLTTLGQWGWTTDDSFDIEHHVRRSALPQPGKIRDLLALCSRLHSTLLDRKRPLWEMHLIEGLEDGRYALYFKVHHALLDGVSAMRLMPKTLSTDPDERGMKAPWAPYDNTRRARSSSGRRSPVKEAVGVAGEVAGLAPALARTALNALRDQGGSVSLNAPRSMLNVDITGSRRFAGQSWPMERLRQVAKASDVTLNDVVLAMCSGALRTYMSGLEQLPEQSLVAMVPVSLHDSESKESDGGGNAVGAVMCRLGTDLDDPAERLATVHASMTDGKASLRGMSQPQILAMSALGVSPLAVWPALRLTDRVRPPFNVIISNVPGPTEPLYWNGARLDGLYPLSIALDGQGLNITCTTYSDEIAFGLTGCRRTVPHLQRLLTYLDDELAGLEKAVGV